MSDLPIEDKPVKKIKSSISEQKPVKGQIEVTDENAAKLTVHFLAEIYARLGYMVKLLEEKKNG
jgi:hypothetical protein